MFSSDSSYLKSLAADLAVKHCAPRSQKVAHPTEFTRGGNFTLNSTMRLQQETTRPSASPVHRSFASGAPGGDSVVRQFLGMSKDPLPTRVPPPIPTAVPLSNYQGQHTRESHHLSPPSPTITSQTYLPQPAPAVGNAIDFQDDSILSPLTERHPSVSPNHVPYSFASRPLTADWPTNVPLMEDTNEPMRATRNYRPLFTDNADNAALNRLEEHEAQLVAHQNRHVKQRAGLTLELDKARWEADQAEFRLTELEAELDGMVQSLRERLESRHQTIRQLRDDSEKQLSALIQSDIKSIPKQFQVEMGKQVRSEQLTSLEALSSHLENKIELECTMCARKIEESLLEPMERLKASSHVAGRIHQLQKDSLQSMQAMIEQFAIQTRQQLEEMREQREEFESKLTARLMKLSEHDPRIVEKH